MILIGTIKSTLRAAKYFSAPLLRANKGLRHNRQPCQCDKKSGERCQIEARLTCNRLLDDDEVTTNKQGRLGSNIAGG